VKHLLFFFIIFTALHSSVFAIIETVVLPKLFFNKSDIIGGTTGERPYRKGGIRIEHETLNLGSLSFDVYHNYGSGGAGATLAPGAAERIVQLFLDNQKRIKSEVPLKVVILGAGYAGLLTAKILVDKGYTVHIYAEHLPESDSYICDPEYTSYVAGGYWMPFTIDYTDLSAHKEMQRISWNKYSEWINNKNYKGLSFRDAYSLTEEDPLDSDSLATGLMTSRPINLQFGENGDVKSGWAFKTILMEGPLFLNSLYQELQKKGVVFCKQKFSSLEQLINLPYKTIFNCTGNGGRKLWKDKNMKGIKGQLVYVNKKPIDCFLFGKVKIPIIQKDGTEDSIIEAVSIYPSSNKTTIGYVTIEDFENLNLDPEITEHLLKKANLLVFNKQSTVDGNKK
jgi:hypothetical protein